MSTEEFDRYIAEIKIIPKDKLKEYASAFEKKVETLKSKGSKSSYQILLIVVTFFLLRNSIIDAVKVGPFNIKDIKLILNYVPLAVAFMMNKSATYFYNSYYHNFFLSLIRRKYFGINKRTILLNKMLPLETERPLTKSKNKKHGLAMCLFQLPIAMVFLTMGILIIPFFYYFVISTIINEYHLNSDLTAWGFWIPNVFAIIFLLTAFQTGVNLIKFLAVKSDFYDKEDLANKKVK